MFWKKKTPKWLGLEKDRVDKIQIGYEMALSDIDIVAAKLQSLAPSDPRLKDLAEYRLAILRHQKETVVGLTGIGPIADEIEKIGDAICAIDDEIHAMYEGGAAGAPFAWGVLQTEAKLERGEPLS